MVISLQHFSPCFLVHRFHYSFSSIFPVIAISAFVEALLFFHPRHFTIHIIAYFILPGFVTYYRQQINSNLIELF